MGPTRKQLEQELAACWKLIDAQKAVIESQRKDMLLELVSAAKSIDCGCTVRERDSGHRIECGIPRLKDAISRAEALMTPNADVTGLAPAQEQKNE